MNHFFTYGTENKNLEELTIDISKLFNVQLKEHESSWWGIYAIGKTSSIKEIKIYPNFVEGEGYHEENTNHEFLLTITDPENHIQIPEIMKNNVSKFELIIHNEYQNT